MINISEINEILGVTQNGVLAIAGRKHGAVMGWPSAVCPFCHRSIRRYLITEARNNNYSYYQMAAIAV
jgi:hypothetical protein